MNRPAARSTGCIIKSGQTCWRQELAQRFALIVDAADYFSALKAAMIRAEKTVFLIGWDFDLRIHLDPRNRDDEWPDKLGNFINALVERKPALEIRLLQWDLGMLKTLARGSTPLFILGWMAHQRVHVRLDHAHPLGASHHQKIVVIDDAIAFCGGIDTTIGRWDTSAHRGKDRRRDSPWGYAQGPWHDATTAVDGAAAQALGILARERWRMATGETLAPHEPAEDAWPAKLRPNLKDVMVGIARTQPSHQKQKAAHEIEALYLAAIGAARRSIYIESQYCASRKIGDALAHRLKERGGPEIVIINPKTAEGWLEEEVMDTARVRVVGMLRDSDREDRFHIYYPVAADGTPIYVHAKIMIVDGRFLKIGSSNLNNRSMGLDTECDLAVEFAGKGNRTARHAIAAIVDGLLAEHLDVEPPDIAAARKAEGSLIGAIEKFIRPRGRTLKPLKLRELNDVEKRLAETQILDPERPRQFTSKLKRLLR
ncbi:MAG: phospholipase [Rhizobiales bacterium]|nr:phospholipase [Hyphomicrobiales bacterium]